MCIFKCSKQCERLIAWDTRKDKHPCKAGGPRSSASVAEQGTSREAMPCKVMCTTGPSCSQLRRCFKISGKIGICRQPILGRYCNQIPGAVCIQSVGPPPLTASIAQKNERADFKPGFVTGPATHTLHQTQLARTASHISGRKGHPKKHHRVCVHLSAPCRCSRSPKKHPDMSAKQHDRSQFDLHPTPGHTRRPHVHPEPWQRASAGTWGTAECDRAAAATNLATGMRVTRPFLKTTHVCGACRMKCCKMLHEFPACIIIIMPS